MKEIYPAGKALSVISARSGFAGARGEIRGPQGFGFDTEGLFRHDDGDQGLRSYRSNPAAQKRLLPSGPPTHDQICQRGPAGMMSPTRRLALVNLDLRLQAGELGPAMNAPSLTPAPRDLSRV